MRRAALLLAIPFALRAQTPEQLFQDRRLAEAKSAFQAQLARDKSDANAMYYLGRIALAENNSDEAADWFEKAVKRNDRSSLYHLWLGNAIGNESADGEQVPPAVPGSSPQDRGRTRR